MNTYATSLARVATSLSVEPVFVRKCERWAGVEEFVGEGAESWERFDGMALSELLGWLQDQQALRLDFTGKEVFRTEALVCWSTARECLEKFGDIFNRTWPTAEADSRWLPRPTVTLSRCVASLTALRSGFCLALAVQEGDTEILGFLAGQPDERIRDAVQIAANLVGGVDSPDFLMTAGRVWLFDRVWLGAFLGDSISVLPHYGASGRASTLRLVPATAEQYMWWSAAITAGALSPPQPLPGAHVCEECKRWFAADRSRIRGDAVRVFCSERCSRRYHNRESARRRRARSHSRGPEGGHHA